MTARPRRTLVLLAALALLSAACAGGDAAGSPEAAGEASPASPELAVAPASFDLAVGDDQRFLAGLFTADRTPILGGEVDMQFSYLGESQAQADAEVVATTTGGFLPVPGKEPEEALAAPTTAAPSGAAGVYETTVDFDRAGLWAVTVDAQLDDGRELQGTAAFPVAPEHLVPAVGEPAPPVENLTVDSDAPAVAIDSRAQGDGAEIPDPELHAVTVADALAQGRPLVLVVSTPTYCVSQFCGPITETVAELAGQYGDVAEFVHIEVWRDFDATELNEAAATWIQTEQGGNEPWVFFVGADGIIQARWDNVLDEAELVDILEGLPSA